MAHQAPLSTGFFRQEYCSGLPFPSPGDLPDPGIESMVPVSPALQANSLPSEPSGKPHFQICFILLDNSSVGFSLRCKKTRVQSLGREDPLEEEMATHCSILAGIIQWTKEPGGLQSMVLQRVRYD